MKMIPIGIYDEDGDALCLMKASDFSDRNYEGIQLRKTKEGMPVIISQSKKTAPLMWKVSYGFSQIFFRTFDEAIEFCGSRGMDMVKGKPE
jgi:hypothetical protein